MNKELFPLIMAPRDKRLVVSNICGGRNLRSRLTDIGLNEGTIVRVLSSSYSGPCIVLAGNMRLVLGCGVARKIYVKEK